MTIYVLGIEPFKMAQVYGIHNNKNIARSQAEYLETNKHKLNCQRYAALTQTEIKRLKLELYR